MHATTGIDRIMAGENERNLLLFPNFQPNLLCMESAFKPVSSSSNHGRNVWLHSYVHLAQNGCYSSPVNESHIAKLEKCVENFFTQELHLKGLSSHSSFNPRKRQTVPSSPTTNSSKKVIFTEFQNETLEENFNFKQYLSPASRTWLADLLGLTKKQVVTWFQNRRAKERRRAGFKLPRHGRKCSFVANLATSGFALEDNISEARIFPKKR